MSRAVVAQAPISLWGRSLTVRRGLVIPTLLLIAWVAATKLGLVNRHIVASPQEVIARAVEVAQEGALLEHLGASLQRDLLGFALGTVMGLGVGALTGLSPLGDKLISPTFHAAKQVAMFAWIPLMSVWFGTGELAKVLFIALAAFYPVVVNVHEGVRSTAREHVEVARAFDYTRWQVARKVVLPGALPSIFAGVHLGLIYAWLGTIGAEYLLAPAPGIGNLMIEGRESFQMDEVLLGVVIVGLVGSSINAVAAKLERRVLSWRVTAFQARQ